MTNNEWRIEARAAANRLAAVAQELEFDLDTMSMETVDVTWTDLQARIVALQEAMEHG